MNEGQDALIEQIKKLQHTVDENHAMLVSIQRRAKMSILLSALKWLVILGITFGSFIFLQPYLEKAFSAYSSISDLSSFQNGTSQATSTGSQNQAEGLINAMRAYLPN